MRRILSFVPWAIVLAFNASDLITTVFNLPKDVSEVWSDLWAVVMGLSGLELALLVVGFVAIAYVFWPEILKLGPASQKEIVFVSGDDRSINNSGINYGIQNTGDVYNAPEPRRLVEESKAHILQHFDKSVRTEVLYSSGAEPFAFAKETIAFLQESGFTNIVEIHVVAQTPPLVGQEAFIDKDGVQFIKIGEQEFR